MIDTHIHVYSEDFTTYPPIDPGPLRAQLDEVPATTEGVLALMERAGVGQAVLVQALAAYGNENSYNIDSMRAHRDRFVSVIYVAPQDPDPVACLEEWVARGAAGIRIAASSGLLQPESLDQSGVALLLQRAGELSLGNVFHLHFPELEQFRALVERSPEVVIALDHCGGFDEDAMRGGPPFAHAAPLVDLAAFPGIHVKVTSMTLDKAGNAGVDGRTLVEWLAGVYGVERLMWGSDWSHTRDRPYEELADMARRAFSVLSSAEQDLCLDANPRRFWKAFSERR